MSFSSRREKEIWYAIKFLESTTNIKNVLKESIGRCPNTKVATEITACLQQGRLFYEAAAVAPLEIRPLQIFYGMLGFAKAVIVARTGASLGSLKPNHGLRDVSSFNSSLENLQIKMERSEGTFHRFNDAVSRMSGVRYYDTASIPVYITIPATCSAKLLEKTIALKEILARVPGLEDLYGKTFGQQAKTWHLSLGHFTGQAEGYVSLRIDVPGIFLDRESLRTIVEEWRQKYPFLRKWRLVGAKREWGNSALTFGNVQPEPDKEFSEESLRGEGGYLRSLDWRQSQKLLFNEILPPLAGGLQNSSTYMIEPFESVTLSDLSLLYLGMYLLSSLVRYRPHIWMRAISKSFSPESSPNGRALALIEQFLDLSLREFPVMTVEAIKFNDKCSG